jgi:hypothetical protein
MPVRKRWPQGCLANRFGITPHQFYEMARRRDHEGFSAQAQRAGFDQPQRLDQVLASLDAGHGS